MTRNGDATMQHVTSSFHIGIGQDSAAWNGVLFRGIHGGLFGVRVGFLDGMDYISAMPQALATGMHIRDKMVRKYRIKKRNRHSFYAHVTRVGSKAPDDSYAEIEAGPLVLRWSVVSDRELLGTVECIRDHTIMAIEAYAPFRSEASCTNRDFTDRFPLDNPARFFAESDTIIRGESPAVMTHEDAPRVTGGVAEVNNRSAKIGDAPEARDYFFLETFSPPLCCRCVMYPDAVEMDLVGDVVGIGAPGEALGFFKYGLSKGETVAFKAGFPEAPRPSHDDSPADRPLLGDTRGRSVVSQGIREHLDRARTVCRDSGMSGAGMFGDAVQIVTSETSWLKSYHPYAGRTLLPAGRAWFAGLNVWGWDECFNGILAMTHDRQVARDTIEWVRGDFRIACMATWKLYLISGDRTILEEAYPVLYPRSHNCIFMPTSSGFGMDDTLLHRYTPAYSCDMLSYAAVNLELLAAMARVLGKNDEADVLSRNGESLKEAIRTRLWNAEEGLFQDRLETGAFVPVKTPTSFYPLFCGAATDKQARLCMEPLFDPGVFGNPYGIPSLNMDHPEYGKPSSEDDSAGGRPFDYWRGNIWPPSSYLVFQGLKRYALDTEAAEFARRHVENWKALYERTGHNPEMLNPVTGRMGGMTFEYHQSWGSLFGLMGVEELMDAEFWKLGALRFGTHQPSTMEEIRNVRIRDTVYSMRVDGNSTVLFANGEELLSGPAETVYRDFVFDEATVRFSANSKRGGPVKIRGKHALDLKPGLQRFG